MTPDPEPDRVAEWMRDTRSAAPSAVEVAAWAAREAGVRERPWNRAERESVLRVAKMVVCLDGMLRVARAARDELLGKLRQVTAAARDAAHTATVALERLEEQEELVLAAQAWVEASRAGSGKDFLAAATRLRAVTMKITERRRSRS